MASTQADVLLTRPVLMPGEENIAASNLRSRRRSGGNNLLHSVPDSSSFIRNTRRSKVGSSLINSSLSENMNASKISSLTSSLLRQNRQESANDNKKQNGLAKQVVDKVVAPAVQQGTSKLLQEAWLGSVETFGLTLLYVNVHVFLRWVIGEKYFCKLGDEWISKINAGSKGKGGATSGMILDLPARGVGVLEAGLIAALDLILLFLLLWSLLVPALIAYLIVNPTEAAQLLSVPALIELVEGAF